MSVTNEALAAALEELALLLELKGENPFKLRAYRRAAAGVRELEGDVVELARAGRLAGIDGVGAAIRTKIESFVERGGFDRLDQLRREFPRGLLELLRIRGLGTKRVLRLYRELGIASPGELEYACLENRLLEMDGFGPRMQEAILEGVRFVQQQGEYHLLDRAHTAAGQVAGQLAAALGQPLRLAAAGALRRGMPVVGEVELLVALNGPAREARIAAALDGRPGVVSIAADSQQVRVGLQTGVPVAVRPVDPDHFFCALMRETGSLSFVQELGRLIARHGLTFSDGCLSDRNGTRLPIADEGEIFRLAGLRPVPPELRETGLWLQPEQNERLPRLIEPADIRGILHVHTRYSDGGLPLEGMVQAAMQRGYRYLGISDHSRSAGYARGLSIEQLQIQMDEIDRLNERYRGSIRLFKGVESDILADGRLDYPDETLARLDFVIASIHSGMSMDRETATDRLIRAVEHPATTIVGHPTGRLLLSREGYPVDIERLLDACAANGTAVELNANPHRLDLDWSVLPKAAERGVPVSINPDAHSAAGLDCIRHGVTIARKGCLGPGQILNCREADELEGFFRQRR